MTVSRVLRNNPHVAPVTREKVLTAAKETGYRANPLVGAWMSHMRTSRARTTDQQRIAFVTADKGLDDWRDSLTVRRYFEGASERAKELGFKLEHFWLGQKGMSGPRMSNILRSRGIAGMLVAPVPQPVSTIGLHWPWFATVAFGYSMREPNLHRVTNHQLHSMRLALEETRKLGYCRIGLALERSKDTRVDYNWTTGLLPYQASIPARDRVPPHLPERLTAAGFLAWVEKEKPQLILSGRQGMVKWLEDAGWRVPEEIGFASLEYYPEYGDLTGVDQNSLTVGAAAVELVVEQLYHNQRGVPKKPKVVLIEGCWHSGNSVRHIGTSDRKGPRSASVTSRS